MPATLSTSVEIGSMTQDARQRRVQQWATDTFGDIANEPAQRGRRFLEEALELHQANRGTREEAHFLVDYVYGRDIGEIGQEIGGVMVTLYSLAQTRGRSVEACEIQEIVRVLTTDPTRFQKRQAEKTEAGL